MVHTLGAWHPRGPMFSRHAKTAFLALILPLALWIGTANMRMTADTQERYVTMAMEHGEPVTVSLTLARETGIRRIDITHDGAETVFVSLPENWRRDEVRGAALEDVTREEPNLGYVRWALPAGSDVTYESPDDWTRAEIENPTGIPLGIKLTTVDLEENTSDYRVILIQDGSALIP